ncbi:MAG: 5-formyltetrahydrofolate cyclo-ligase [Candidatus Gracilibacteria bacterium]|nr:5-formyltetrahydrofolate cyclo-ligase [Candidatus Gracilibacteria bacterium]
MNKSEIRQTILVKRDALNAVEITDLSFKIGEKLLQHPKFQVAQKILLYAAKGSEVQTLDLIEQALKLGKEVYLPKVEGEELRIYGTRGLRDLKGGAFGILEPTLNEELDPADLDLIILPGVAFDQRGYRIGYGKGYYDRLLKKTKAYTIGLSYDFQFIANLPHEEHDVAVDEVITKH